MNSSIVIYFKKKKNQFPSLFQSLHNKHLKSKKIINFGLCNLVVLCSSVVSADHDHVSHSEPGFRYTQVGTGPFFGLGESFLGTDLVVLQPAINTDLALLKENQKVAKNIGIKDEQRAPYVQMGGLTEVQGIFETNSKNQVAFTAAQLTIDAWVNPWMTAFSNFGIEIDETYNNSFRMVTGFMTLGNLDKLPVYATAGQIFVPFGNFSTGTSDMGTLTRTVGRIYQRALNVGYYPGNGFHIASSIYNGRTRNSKTYNVDHYAGQASYSTDINFWGIPAKVKTGASYTNNMADAGSLSRLFKEGAILKKIVPGADVFANFNLGPFVLRGEYLSALQKFSSEDILQNGSRIKPSSYYGEVEYDTYLFGRESWLALHYSTVTDAAAMTPIHNQYGINGSVNILKNTIVSLEYSNRNRYSSHNLISNNSTNSSGGTVTNSLNPTTLAAVNAGLNGSIRNVVIATVDLFF